MKRTIPIILAAAFVVTGCATSPVGVTQSRPVPQSKVKATPARAVASMAEGGRVIIVRDTGLLGGGGGLRLLVDGLPVADLATADRYEVILAEGEYILGLLPSVNLFSASTVKETAVFVRKGQTYTFRVGLDASGLFIQRSTLSGR